MDVQGKTWLRALRVRCPARALHHQACAPHKRTHIENHTAHHTQRGCSLCSPTPIGTVVFPFVCVEWCVVFYVSVLLCGARVLDDVRREAQAGQRTRKARSQVLPCKPRYSAYACWLRKDLQEKSTFPNKDIVFSMFGYNFAIVRSTNA